MKDPEVCLNPGPLFDNLFKLQRPAGMTMKWQVIALKCNIKSHASYAYYSSCLFNMLILFLHRVSYLVHTLSYPRLKEGRYNQIKTRV